MSEASPSPATEREPLYADVILVAPAPDAETGSAIARLVVNAAAKIDRGRLMRIQDPALARAVIEDAKQQLLAELRSFVFGAAIETLVTLRSVIYGDEEMPKDDQLALIDATLERMRIVERPPPKPASGLIVPGM